jgi:hypothetical protein
MSDNTAFIVRARIASSGKRQYLAGDSRSIWTYDADRAQRFSTREEAETAATENKPWIKATRFVVRVIEVPA